MADVTCIMTLGAESTASGCPFRTGGLLQSSRPTLRVIRGRRCAMSDYELLMIVFTVVGIVIATLKSNDR